MKKFSTLLLFITISFLLVAQKGRVKQADLLYNNLAYIEASELYTKALSKDSSESIMVKLANCYYKMNDYSKAVKWYKSAFSDSELVYDNGKFYAQSLKNVGNYNELRNFLNKNFEDKNLFNNLVEVDEAKNHVSKYVIEKVSFNSDRSEFASFFNDNKLYVTKEVELAKTPEYPWTGKGYEDLYIIEANEHNQFTELKGLDKQINTRVHEGAASFDVVNQELYFTRNNLKNKRIKKDKSGAVNLKIFSAKKQEESWAKPVAFPYNSDDYSNGHPHVSEDGNTLYYVSDKEGGYGGTDIYFCKKQGDSWGAPINLGPEVNTKFNEMFPIIYGNDELYFSSEGFNTLGGLDVFKMKKVDSKWQKVENLGAGINSSGDDFYLLFDNEEKNQGYFSSNRNNEDGSDDIYAFKLNEDLIKEDTADIPYTVNVFDEEKGDRLSGVSVDLFLKSTNEKVFSNTTNENGEAVFMVDPNKDYKAVINKDGYFDSKENALNTNDDSNISLYKNELNKSIRIKNIYYKLDRAEILPPAARELDKIVKILRDNPNVNIELSSHTDSRADNIYNIDLSTRRAKSATSYIVSKGISQYRISSVGYGESLLTNQCSDGVYCSEQEHLQNRRTEFKVVGYSDDNFVSDDASLVEYDVNELSKKNTSRWNSGSVTKQKLYSNDFYAVQVGSFRKFKRRRLSQLKAYGDLSYLKENDLYVYYLSHFSTIAEAKELSNTLKNSNTVENSFVIQVLNGKRVFIPD